MFVFQAQLDIHHFVLTKHKIPLWFTPDGKFTVEVDNNHLTLVSWCIYITPQESNSHSPTSLFSPATLTSSLTVTPEEILCLYYTLQINSLLCALRILWCFATDAHEYKQGKVCLAVYARQTHDSVSSPQEEKFVLI